MRPHRKVALLSISCAILALVSGCKNAQAPKSKDAQTPGSADASVSCRRFAQSFYDWYVPFTQGDVSGPAWNVALERKPDVLYPDLFKALRADSDAQAHANGELVGIDFDPFVGSQDPAAHYEARGAKSSGDRCSVEVWRASPTDTAAKTGKPDVIAELAQDDGRWRFLNFRYPNLKADLVSVLAEMRRER